MIASAYGANGNSCGQIPLNPGFGPFAEQAAGGSNSFEPADDITSQRLGHDCKQTA
jgi:hypothetical protein